MKTKRTGRQCFSLPFGKTAILSLVTFAMVIGLFLGMSVKAYADPSGTGVSSLPSTAGTYYLTDNVTISSSWTPVNGITLDLNGKTITMNESGDAITVSNGVTLTIKDSSSSNSGKITHASNIRGRGVQVKSGGTFHMTGGSITANNCSAEGAGVYVAGAGLIFQKQRYLATRQPATAAEYMYTMVVRFLWRTVRLITILPINQIDPLVAEVCQLLEQRRFQEIQG